MMISVLARICRGTSRRIRRVIREVIAYWVSCVTVSFLLMVITKVII